MTECSAAANPNSNNSLGCENAKGEIGCTSAATTAITKPTTDIEKKDNSATALALKTTFAIPLFYADKFINIGEAALGIALPFITKVQNLRREINKSLNTDEEDKKEDLLSNANKNFFIKETDNLINSTTKEIENLSKDSMYDKNFNNIIDKLNKNITKLYEQLIISNPNKINQTGGGKKIISRTNQSINQFLNPKITSTNMLKSKSKRKRVTTKYKTKSKKRTRY